MNVDIWEDKDSFLMDQESVEWHREPFDVGIEKSGDGGVSIFSNNSVSGCSIGNLSKDQVDQLIKFLQKEV